MVVQNAIIVMYVAVAMDLADLKRVLLLMDLIQERLVEWCDSGDIDVIMTTGGTGLVRRVRARTACPTAPQRTRTGSTLVTWAGHL